MSNTNDPQNILGNVSTVESGSINSNSAGNGPGAQVQQPEPQQPVAPIVNVTKAAQNTLDIRPPAIIAAAAINKMQRIGSIEVHLPVLNESVKCYGVKSLTDVEIKTLAGSIHVYKTAILQAIYQAVEFNPKSSIQSFEDFIKLPYADICMVLFGVLKTSFSTGLHNNYTCVKCNQEFKSNVSMDAVQLNQVKTNYQAKQSIFEDTFVDTVLDSIQLVFGFDQTTDKIAMLDSMSNDETREKLINFGTLFTPTEVRLTKLKKIIITIEDGQIFTLDDKDSIKTFINQLDIGTREILNDRINKTCGLLDEYVPKFKVDINCPHCKHKMTWEDFDPMVEFFHKISTLL